MYNFFDPKFKMHIQEEVSLGEIGDVVKETIKVFSNTDAPDFKPVYSEVMEVINTKLNDIVEFINENESVKTPEETAACYGILSTSLFSAFNSITHTGGVMLEAARVKAVMEDIDKDKDLTSDVRKAMGLD